MLINKAINNIQIKVTKGEQDEARTIAGVSRVGLYYYGARYLDAKYSRWLSTDPAVGEYIPQAPVNDEAKKHNQSLPGQGGIFNIVNLQLYHYAGNNPVKYTDPDGRFVNVPIGAAVGFVSSAATEIGGRMINGQSFGDAVKNTFTDKTSLAIIGTSTLIGAATSGVSGLAVNATTKAVTTAASAGLKTGAQAIGEIAVKTVAINTVAGAVDAGAKDIVTHAIKGESESFGEIASTMGKGVLSAALFSGVTQGVIAAGTTTSGQIGNVLTGTMKEFNINQPKWAGATGVVGESVVPTIIDIKNSIAGDN
nr:hypothetical protein [Treponema parvum]